jgi:hypothetical protein
MDAEMATRVGFPVWDAITDLPISDHAASSGFSREGLENVILRRGGTPIAKPSLEVHSFMRVCVIGGTDQMLAQVLTSLVGPFSWHLNIDFQSTYRWLRMRQASLTRSRDLALGDAVVSGVQLSISSDAWAIACVTDDTAVAVGGSHVEIPHLRPAIWREWEDALVDVLRPPRTP